MFFQSVEIPNYPDEIIVTRARRPVYYVSQDSGKKGVKRLPKKYTTEEYEYDRDGFLIEKKTGKKVVANTRSVGKSRKWVVNFQEIWNGNVARQKRAHYMNFLKDILRPFIQEFRVVDPSSFPLAVEIHLYSYKFNVDASNKGPIYIKIIEDLLVTEGKIPDDSPQYINDTGRIKLHLIKEGDPKMIIKLYSSHETSRI